MAKEQELDWFMDGVEPKVTEQQAKAEVLNWLKKLNLSGRKRRERAQFINTLLDAIIEGDLSINKDDGTFHQKLRVPSKATKTLDYSFRLNVKEFSDICKSNEVSPTDTESRINAAVAVMTGKLISEIESLSQDDLDVAASIALFFM